MECKYTLLQTTENSLQSLAMYSQMHLVISSVLGLLWGCRAPNTFSGSSSMDGAFSQNKLLWWFELFWVAICQMHSHVWCVSCGVIVRHSAVFAYCFAFVSFLFIIVSSWCQETKKLPHINFKSQWSIGNLSLLAHSSIIFSLGLFLAALD